jgi:hypothetical protein
MHVRAAMLKVLRVYGTLNGNIATIVKAKCQIDNNPFFCADASGTGDLNIPAQRNDGECIDAQKAPFMWIVPPQTQPNVIIDMQSLMKGA